MRNTGAGFMSCRERLWDASVNRIRVMGILSRNTLTGWAGRGEDIEIGTIFYKGKAYPSREITTGMETYTISVEELGHELENDMRNLLDEAVEQDENIRYYCTNEDYARFPIGKWIRLYTDRQQTDMETPIKVVFRRFKEGGVIALFPYIPWNESENTITSYMHAGQHGAADYKGIISGTLPATEKEYRSLLVELKSIGYGNLHVLERAHARQKFFL